MWDVIKMSVKSKKGFKEIISGGWKTFGVEQGMEGKSQQGPDL